MGKQVMLDARIFAGAYDISGNTNKITVASEIAEKDVTNFASGGAKEVIGGLESWKLTGEGQWEAGAPGKVDNAMWAGRGQVAAWTVCPNTATVGDLAWLSKAVESAYTLGATVGDVASWSANAAGSYPLVRGVILHPPGTARTDDGSGTALQLGALAEGERLHACLHVLSASGAAPTLDVTIESDTEEAFGDTPETRLSFTQATGLTDELVATAAAGVGGHADDWYRVAYDISEVGDESFLFVVSLGIG